MADEYPCTAKYLPSELAIDAAATAVQQNPVNRPSLNGSAGMILAPEQIAVMTSKWWGNKGVHLTVAFQEPTPVDLQKRILSHMNAWSQYCNVDFVISTTDPQVRITRSGQGFWSYLGTDVLHVNKNEATMCLERFSMQTPESEFKRVVRHETGHTLGCPHEHMRRAIINRLDSQKTISYFRQTQGWSPAMTTQNVLTPLAETSLMGSPDADETSIMTYSLPGIITKDGIAIPGGNDIQEQDAEFMAKIYPKQTAPPPPPGPPVTSHPTIQFDLTTKKGSFFNWPSGWVFTKGTPTGTAAMSSTELTAIADGLEAALPTAGTDLESAKASSLGGVVGAVLSLVAAIRSGDMNAIIKAMRDLLNVLLGDDDTQVIGFQQSAIGQRVNWAKLIEWITKLLPLILGA
jgi:hypothetical protein